MKKLLYKKNIIIISCSILLVIVLLATANVLIQYKRKTDIKSQINENKNLMEMYDYDLRDYLSSLNYSLSQIAVSNVDLNETVYDIPSQTNVYILNNDKVKDLSENNFSIANYQLQGQDSEKLSKLYSDRENKLRDYSEKLAFSSDNDSFKTNKIEDILDIKADSKYLIKSDELNFLPLTKTDFFGLEFDNDQEIEVNNKKMSSLEYVNQLDKIQKANITEHENFDSLNVLNNFNHISIYRNSIGNFNMYKEESKISLKDLNVKNKKSFHLLSKEKLINKIKTGDLFLFETDENNINLLFNSKLTVKNVTLGYYQINNEDNVILLPIYIIMTNINNTTQIFYTEAIDYETILNNSSNLISNNDFFIHSPAISEINFLKDSDEYEIKGKIQFNLDSKEELKSNIRRIYPIFPAINRPKFFGTYISLVVETQKDIDSSLKIDQKTGSFSFKINRSNFWNIYNSEKLRYEARDEHDNYMAFNVCIVEDLTIPPQYCSGPSESIEIRLYPILNGNNNPIKINNENFEESKVIEVE